MYDRFKAISLSYKNAPIQIREAIALDENVISGLLTMIKEYFPQVEEAIILSTCNRTEIYYVSDIDFFTDFIKLIGIRKGLPEIANYYLYFERYDSDDAIQRLFDVSAGLEAQVVGDMQIANQVKRAYQSSSDLEMAGPFLHRLMHTVFYTNKRIVQETAFRDGAASVSYAAIELVEELTSHIVNPKILAIGLGEIGIDVCKSLSAAKFEDVQIANRSGDKALAIAETCGYKTIDFLQTFDAIKNADVIISSLSGNNFQITKQFIESLNIPGYKYFIDLGVPRSIEQSIEHVPGVLLYNIDNIRNKTTEALNKRLAAIPDVKAIISASISDFKSWSKEMEVSPTIKKFKDTLEKIRKDEIARHLKDLNEKESDKVDKITKSIMQKIIKLPVLHLKAACKRGDAENLIGVLNELFDLEKAAASKAKK
jgi:glutamyl-tRNA reductase